MYERISSTDNEKSTETVKLNSTFSLLCLFFVNSFIFRL